MKYQLIELGRKIPLFPLQAELLQSVGPYIIPSTELIIFVPFLSLFLSFLFPYK